MFLASMVLDSWKVAEENINIFDKNSSCEVLLPRPEESNEQVTELQVTGDNDGLVERFHNGNNTVYTSSINIILLDHISLIEEFVK